ncbi:MAG: GPR endopeptidase [Clostridia bacterium]|nr:GPR endopeptidase [Clostridia bacterium]
MKNYFFTDLSLEKRGYQSDSTEKITENIHLFRNFPNHSSSDKENYVMFFTPKIWEINAHDFSILERKIADELRRMMHRLISPEGSRHISVLVVGLGNQEITSDAIGPETVRHLTVTRHLPIRSMSSCRVSAIAPGVLGSTGMETVEVILGVVQRTAPDLVIAIDALAARSLERLAAAIQISDGGILPGSGIGNMRKALSRDTLGIPVIAIGVPTVVNSATLVAETLGQCGIQQINDDLRDKLESGKSCFVTPKESDLLLKSASLLLAVAINRACQET